MKYKQLEEYLNIHIAKNPKRFVLAMILMINVVFLLVSAGIISRLAPSTLEHRGFWISVFYTISMILDAGCIDYVVNDVGQAGVAAILICVLVAVVGMIIFTGAVIGYATTWISDYVMNANSGKGKIRASGHTVILN